jgi:hypothetical protein
MANKPFKDITDRGLFAGLVMAALPASEPDKPTSVHASRAVDAADHLIATLKVPIGKPPSNAMRGRRQDDIDDRNARQTTDYSHVAASCVHGEYHGEIHSIRFIVRGPGASRASVPARAGPESASPAGWHHL